MSEFKGDIILQGITLIKVPGAKQTTVTGINNYGQIVGHFTDNKNNRHGFLYEEGVYSQPVDCPNVEETYALGVNSLCQVVGRCKNGFLYSKGRFSPALIYPDSALTTPNDINDFGDIVGAYQDANGKSHGFLYSAGEFYPIDGPDGKESFASGINDGGQIAGGVADSSGSYGFVYLENAGVYSTTLQYPGSKVTYPHGINNRGQIVGIFHDKKGNDKPFLCIAGSCHEIKLHRARSASALDINDHGQVIGHFYDGGDLHAYLGVVLP